jgi:VIT1/CCC1 family predicted Fe2+/Mn2+ transporter
VENPEDMYEYPEDVYESLRDDGVDEEMVRNSLMITGMVICLGTMILSTPSAEYMTVVCGFGIDYIMVAYALMCVGLVVSLSSGTVAHRICEI